MPKHSKKETYESGSNHGNDYANSHGNDYANSHGNDYGSNHGNDYDNTNIECHNGPEHKHKKKCVRYVSSYVKCKRDVSYRVKWQYKEPCQEHVVDGKECGKDCKKD